MNDRVAFDFAGEALVALADRALWWPARACLLVADLHLGKGDVFRRAGIAVPRGGTAQDLARLGALLADTGARELVVLGDLLHGPVPDAAWRAQWLDWRAAHGVLQVRVIAGNHDRALGAAALAIDLQPDGTRIGGLSLHHEPTRVPDAGILCGHLHPVFSPPGLQRRFPGFWLRRGMLVLPAFSAFTGGWRVALAPGERALLCVEQSLVPLGASQGAVADPAWRDTP